MPRQRRGRGRDDDFRAPCPARPSRRVLANTRVRSSAHPITAALQVGQQSGKRGSREQRERAGSAGWRVVARGHCSNPKRGRTGARGRRACARERRGGRRGRRDVPREPHAVPPLRREGPAATGAGPRLRREGPLDTCAVPPLPREGPSATCAVPPLRPEGPSATCALARLRREGPSHACVVPQTTRGVARPRRAGPPPTHAAPRRRYAGPSEPGAGPRKPSLTPAPARGVPGQARPGPPRWCIIRRQVLPVPRETREDPWLSPGDARRAACQRAASVDFASDFRRFFRPSFDKPSTGRRGGARAPPAWGRRVFRSGGSEPQIQKGGESSCPIRKPVRRGPTSRSS